MTPDQTQPTPPKNRSTRWYMWIIYVSIGSGATMITLYLHPWQEVTLFGTRTSNGTPGLPNR